MKTHCRADGKCGVGCGFMSYIGYIYINIYTYNQSFNHAMHSIWVIRHPYNICYCNCNSAMILFCYLRTHRHWGISYQWYYVSPSLILHLCALNINYIWYQMTAESLLTFSFYNSGTLHLQWTVWNRDTRSVPCKFGVCNCVSMYVCVGTDQDVPTPN